MAFNSITIGSKTFVSIGTGTYQNNTVTFGQPNDLLKITGGKKAAANAATTCSVSRHIEKDVTVCTGIERRKLSIVLQISMPEGFTPTESDTLLGEISTFVDAATLNRILMGEQ